MTTNAGAVAVIGDDRRTARNALRGRRVTVVLLAIVVLSAADLLVTIGHLKTIGMMEANPIAAWLVRTTASPWALSLFKSSTVAIAVLLLFRLRHRTAGEIGSWCGFAILAVVALMWRSYSDHFESPVDVQIARSGMYSENWLVLE